MIACFTYDDMKKWMSYTIEYCLPGTASFWHAEIPDGPIVSSTIDSSSNSLCRC